MDDDNFVFMPIEDIPGPSHAFHVRNEDNEGTIFKILI